ncbi:uncharacterized protein EI90DRAFT_3020862 [Cantharellus anzutake]|uniref:uncharacterized protein n=1 Tax=Cantharellus anzutake TaxID=1750568 RepID=UPI0019065728|nr:uncharacterized protein EI90DRAFT_3020862 [Cantharellus anzutake]KAF8319160.1 hypothetical protein EI90DRAFT_3020862 [Cantharellus anzutake]
MPSGETSMKSIPTNHQLPTLITTKNSMTIFPKQEAPSSVDENVESWQEFSMEDPSHNELEWIGLYYPQYDLFQDIEHQVHCSSSEQHSGHGPTWAMENADLQDTKGKGELQTKYSLRKQEKFNSQRRSWGGGGRWRVDNKKQHGQELRTNNSQKR